MLRNKALTNQRKGKLATAFNAIIREHAPQRHSSEVAWSLWACLSFGLTVETDGAELILQMEDSVCALLLLQAFDKGLCALPKLVQRLKRAVGGDDLYGSRWLLAYELVRSGKVATKGGLNYVKQDPHFEFLLDENVSFFDGTKVGSVPPGLLPSGPEDAVEPLEDEPENEERDEYSEGDFWEEWDEWDDDDDDDE